MFPSLMIDGHPPPITGVGIAEEERICILYATSEFTVERSLILDILGGTDVPIEHVVSGPILLSARPAQGGDSISCVSPGNRTGSIGCVVHDPAMQPLVLSCNHVLALANAGVPQVEEIRQPGVADGGSPGDRIGLLHSFKQLVFGGVLPNQIDAALAEADQAGLVVSGIRQLGGVAGIQSNPPFNLPVQKQGRRTGLTQGVLRYQKLSLIVPYPGAGDALFENQYGIVGLAANQPFAEQGDSGAIVVDGQIRAVGMVFSVASQMNLTFANPIEPVLDFFGVDIA